LQGSRNGCPAADTLTFILRIVIGPFMETGNIVEYIDRQKIICAVVLDIKKTKLQLLTESNREVALSSGRLLHVSGKRLDPLSSRDRLIEILKETVERRTALIAQIDIKALWEILHSEQEWIDMPTITGLCFPNNATSDHESAVIRALFQNRLYFKFNQDRFYPYTEEQVERMMAQAEEAARKIRMIEQGTEWLKAILNGKDLPITDKASAFIEILKSSFLFGNASEHYTLCKEMLSKSGISNMEDVFAILVKLNVFDKNENVDLYRMEIPTTFTEKTLEHVTKITKPAKTHLDNGREDLTCLNIMTIDGPDTQDFDDALSIENKGGYNELGIHIIDVGHFIKKNDAIDQEALSRGSSIYMPDQKIPMLHPNLAEDLCSLKAKKLKPAISILVKLTPLAETIDYKIIPSYINVAHQLTYIDVDAMADNHQDITRLFDIAKKFRKKRFEQGAVHISLPEINIWTDEKGEINLQRIDRESPGRMLVSEIMIMANWIAAKYLAEHDTPAIFRSQPEPRERLYKGDGGTLFQNYMQRRRLNRFVLGNKPERHCGLGLDAYVTTTSPIRKYFDLVTQRQIRAILGLETPYNADEINHIIQLLELPFGNVAKIQSRRNRYWILKYLEKKIGEIQEAIVLVKRRNNYQVLLPEFMIECELPLSSGIKLKSEDLIQVKIQHVDARKNLLSVFM